MARVRQRRLPGGAGEQLDRDRGEDRQRGPRDQDGTEVVAVDVRVDVRGVEEAGDRHGGPCEERVAGAAERRYDEPDGDERREDAELGDGPRDELPGLSRQLAERIRQAALELLGEDDVAKAVPGVRGAVDEARPERTGPERQLEVDQDD